MEAEESGNDTKHTEVIEDEEDLQGEVVRGYQDGKPYFHRELSEQDKKLIGDISPQPLGRKGSENVTNGGPPQQVAQGTTMVAPSTGGGSAWNAAQTWEERDWTPWAMDRFKEIMSPQTVSSSSGEVEVSITAIESVDGHAHVAVVRGRPRYIWDFSFKLKFEASPLDSGSPYKGTLVCHELGYDSKDDFEMEIEWKDRRPEGKESAEIRKLLLQNEVHEAIKARAEAFEEEFRQK
mmetsp:Transcript_5476/g.8267  ORF Transcript_5476/g.8267 Transcript_5476/m.8267 type:complete len:236 (-) Transcript_5476:130-837(-)|eukprot:CAMPEP_0113936366 /NCGR_PEP_ID=MMETSP1339-20121228/3305_1 /TAXON_ID=94617 /ORGANISM="Fibrocapsa japonica" /LENGTH=235 /DNA_ID=CAMNT_0000938825 /DNA_START=106 /DNA_END=813 /DNA_ORIENTATION=+ /assembly_acc=CAM_ASM_000762